MTLALGVRFKDTTDFKEFKSDVDKKKKWKEDLTLAGNMCQTIVSLR